MVDTIKIQSHGNTKMVAHRGLSGIETENTAVAFVAAANRSYYGIETDIWRTADGKFILNHDGRTGRIAHDDYRMESTILGTLRSIRLNDSDGQADRGEIMLCLPSEYRKICQRYGKVCVPELKSDFTLEEIKEILAIFDGYLDNTVFISFNIHNLELVKELRPEQKVQFLTDDASENMAKLLQSKNMGIDIYHSALDKEALDRFHAYGVEVNCWTVDNPERVNQLISYGVDYITSNICE